MGESKGGSGVLSQIQRYARQSEGVEFVYPSPSGILKFKRGLVLCVTSITFIEFITDYTCTYTSLFLN